LLYVEGSNIVLLQFCICGHCGPQRLEFIHRDAAIHLHELAGQHKRMHHRLSGASRRSDH
jgi:hypothetical protein